MDIIILGKARRGGERVKETESNKAKARVGTGSRRIQRQSDSQRTEKTYKTPREPQTGLNGNRDKSYQRLE
jgi:hypothetical protein